MRASILEPRVDLSKPRPLQIALPILLSGDLVLSPEHLGPAYLAAVLRNAGAEVRLYEVELGNEESLIAELVATRPHIVGISLTTVAIDQARSFGERLRRVLGRGPFILAGGPVATHLGERLLMIDGWGFLDGLIRGEGEVPMLRLAEALHVGGDLSHIPNLCYRANDAVQATSMQPGLSNLDLLPFPVRDQLAQHGGRLPYLRVSTSRGCTAHCTFCNAPHARNRVGPAVKAWRGVNPIRVVDEIEMLVRNYGCNTFDFVDSTFEDPGGGEIGKSRVKAIAQEILDRGLKIFFNVCMQAYNWNDDDRPLLDLLWRAGLEKVLVGIEAGSEVGLRRWQKRSTISDNRRVIRLLREVGVYVAFGFISFHPWSTFAEVRQNQIFLRDQLGHNLRRFTTRLELYPGAEIIEVMRAEELLDEDYFKTLNPFAYRYRDPRMHNLAACLNALYGREYSENCLIREEPAVFRFETYDIMVHNFTSRLRRAYNHDAIAMQLVDELAVEVEATKAEMTHHNFALVQELTDLAERDCLQIDDALRWAAPTEAFVADRMQSIDRAKFRCGLNLRRHGCDVAAIAGTSRDAGRLSA